MTEQEPIRLELTRDELQTVVEALMESEARWQRRPGFRGNTVEAGPYTRVHDAIAEQLRVQTNGE